MIKFFKAFLTEEGAVPVDWVVLTALIVGLGVALVSDVKTNDAGEQSQVESSD